MINNNIFNVICSLGFNVSRIENQGHAIYAKFLSEKVGMYFLYEFRDVIPEIQLSKIVADDFNVRPGLYTIRELYKQKNFILDSFYLDEILAFRGAPNYQKHFEGIKTIEDGIKVSAELLEKYAMDFVKGDEKSYMEMDKWYRKYVASNE